MHVTNILIIGTNPRAVRFAQTLENKLEMGYRVRALDSTSGPITAIWIDRDHGTLWGAASNNGEDTGIAW